jgi:outer membrane protein assembly factor BamC
VQYWIPASVIASLFISGCSLFPQVFPEQATAAQSRAVAELKVPAGLNSPKKPAQFDIPAAPNAPVTEVELKSPMQVLALATNSRVEEEEKEARIWFERSEFTGALLPYLQNNIQSFGTDKNISITQKDQQGLAFETGWVSRFEEEGFWLWKELVEKEQSRFLVTLEPKPHGRAVGMRVQLLEHRYIDNDKKLSAIAQKREEVYFLNRLVDKVATVELAQIKQKKAQSRAVTLTTGFDDEGNAVMLTGQTLDQAWAQLELLFEPNGFVVNDLNRTDYIYYLTYEKPDTGFWDSLWGDEEQIELALESGDYQLALKKSVVGTSLQWRDSTGKALSPAQVTALYEGLVQLIKKDNIEL